MKFVKLTPIAMVTTLMVSGAFAQTSVELNPVTVLGQQEATPGAQVIKGVELNARKAVTSDTAALILNVPGVSMYSAGGVSGLPSVHGLADDRLRIKVDGMDLISSCPNHMNSPLSYIDPSNVDSITVMTGVSPVSAGGDSIGAVISVKSAAPEFAEAGQTITKGEVGSSYRSNGDAISANGSVTVANDRFSARYNGSTAKSDNYEAAENFKTTAITGRVGHTLPLDEVGSTAYKANNHELTLANKVDGHLIQMKVGIQDIPYEAYPNQRMDMLDNKSTQVNLSHEGKYSFGKIESRVYHQHVKHYMNFGDDKRYWYGSASAAGAGTGHNSENGQPCASPSSTCAAGMPMYTKSDLFGFSSILTREISDKKTLKTGVDLQQYTLDDWWPPSGSSMSPNTFQNINNGQRDRYGIFAELQNQHSQTLMSILGVRYEMVTTNAGNVQGYGTRSSSEPPVVDLYGPPSDRIKYDSKQSVDSRNFNSSNRKQTDHNIDLSGILKYEPNQVESYDLGLSRKNRSPNLYERYGWSTWEMASTMNNYAGDGNGYVGNANLKPETAYTLSTAANWNDASKEIWGVRLNPYYTYVDNYIDAQCNGYSTRTRTPVESACAVNKFRILQYTNQRAELYGVDLSGYRSLGKVVGYGEFKLTGNVSYVQGENKATGDNLYNIMPLNARVALIQKIGSWTNALEGQFVTAKEDVSAVRNEMKTGGYSLFNLRASYEEKKYRFTAGIDNLFDKFYYLPQGGAYLGQGTTMMMGPDVGIATQIPPWGRGVPGMGRSFNVGVNVKF
jgi:iron complex outermembrane receptor protein